LVAAYYEDMAGRLYGLVIRLSGRLPAGQAGWLHHVTGAGEYGLAVEDMTGMLACGMIAVTDRERGDMLALARQMGTDDLIRQALRSCARAGEARDPGA